jgi:two-component system chemotaxis sensor kinase CheA
VRLSKYFNTGAFSGKKEGDYTVIVEPSAKKFGLVVDALKGKQEIVIKTLSGILRNVKSFSGATILGDGRVVLILDVVSVSGG